MRKLTILLAGILMSFAGFGQMTEKWEAEAGDPITWNAFAPDGTLIVGTDEKTTVAFEAGKGEVLWKKNFNYGKFNILPNTPYIYFDWSPDEVELLVLNPATGKVLCNPKELGMENIQAFYPVRAGNNLLVYTQMNDREQFWMVDLDEGGLLWKKDLDLDKDVEIAGGFVTLEEHEDKKGLMCDPVGDGQGGMYVAVHDRLIHFDGEGVVKWDIEYPSQFGDQKGFFKAVTVDHSQIFPSQDGQKLYIFSGPYMTCHNITDGSQYWEKPVKVSGPVTNLIFIEDGIVLIPAQDENAFSKNEMNMVNPENGEVYWGDGLKYKGGFVQSAFCSKGIVFVTKAQMADKYFFNIVNPESGEFELKKEEKLFPGPFQFEEVNGGLLISSKSGANIYKYDSKEFVVDKELKTGNNDYLVKLDAGNNVYFYNSNKNNIYVFDKTALTAKEFNKDKIKLKGSDQVKGMDMYKDGILLYSEQDLVKFDWDGNILWEKTYKAPGERGINIAGQVLGATFKALGSLASVAGAQITAQMVEDADQFNRGMMHAMGDAYAQSPGMDPAKLKEYNQSVSEYEQNMDGLKTEMNKELNQMSTLGVADLSSISSNISAISKRFGSSKATKNYLIIMTKLKEEGVGLAIVSKLDGEVKGFIPMQFNRGNPCYTVDPFTNQLFWMPSLDNKGANIFGKKRDTRALMNAGAVFCYDLNAL